MYHSNTIRALVAFAAVTWFTAAAQAAPQWSDDFEDGVIDANLWVYGGRAQGTWSLSHQEVAAPDGYLEANVQGPTSGGTVGAEAWLRTTYDFNDGVNWIIDFKWEAIRNAVHQDFFFLQIGDGYFPAQGSGESRHWIRQDESGRATLWGVNLASDGTQYYMENGDSVAAPPPPFPQPYDNPVFSGPVDWSVLIDSIQQTATLYMGPGGTGDVYATIPLDVAYPWYMRFFLSDWTSSSFPAGDNSLYLYSFAAVPGPAALLLGEWRLDEGAGAVAYDSSGNGYNGDIFGGATWIPGKCGTALHFDGIDDYIEIPGTADWAFPLGITLMASVKLTDYNSDSWIVSNHVSGTNAGYGLIVRDDHFSFLVASWPTNSIQTAETYRDGRWHDVVGMFDATTGLQSLYVDGELKAQQVTVPPYPDPSPALVRIGAYTEGQYAEKLVGDIDEVKIYHGPVHELDCNTNCIPDACDLDCGSPGGICDVPGCGQSGDCNSNGLPDECELEGNDCNTNGIPDECDEPDGDGDGVPDECDDCPSTPPGAVVDWRGRPLGDIDLDCDTDLDDYALFQQGFTGPGS